MTDRHWQTVLRRAGAIPGTESTDRELLGRFLADCDEASFAALVERHGGMVLAVCRRALRNEQDAEDTCQAAFLVLARSAASIRSRTSLASWLHGVALRLARKMRAGDARRRTRDAHAAGVNHPGPEAEASWREVQEALDEELGRLPEKFRAPLVLCYLEGLSRDEAAAWLGVSLSTVRGRLELGRERLRSRLARRGVTLTAVLLAPVVADGTAVATVPATLVVATARLAATLAAGRPFAAESRSVSLAHEGVTTMLATKLLAGASLLLVLVVGVVSAALPTRVEVGSVSRGEGQKAAVKKAEDANAPTDPLPPGAVARLGTTRLRTTASAIAVAPDGKTLRTAAGGRTIGRWDAETGRLLDEVHPKTPAGERCWFSPDGRCAAIPDTQGVGLYDATTGERKQTVAVDDKSHMTVAVFSPDGLALATAEYESKDGTGTGRVRLWPAGGGESIQVALLPSYVNGLAFGPDGKRLYAAVDNHSVRCWDTATLKELWKNDHWARHVAVSPDGKTIATDTYQDGPLRLWDAETGRNVATLDVGKRSWSRQVSFSPDGRVVAFGTNDAVLLWDAATHKLLHRLEGAGPALAFAPDSGSVFTLGPLLERWDVRTGKPLYPNARADGHVGPVAAIAFAPDGRSVATAGRDGTLRVWDRAAGTHKVVGGSVGVSAGRVLAFAPDGLLLTSGEKAGELALLDPDTGRVTRRFALPQRPQSRTDVAAAQLTPDGSMLLALGTTQEQELGGGKLIAQGQPETVRGWEVATGKSVLEKTVACQPWSLATISPTGRFVVRAGFSELHDVRTGLRRPLVAAPRFGLQHYAFSTDGRWLATAEPGEGEDWQRPKSVLVYETLTGRRVARAEGDLGGACPALAFSPDGRLAAAPGSDALHVWEVTTGRRVMHLPVRGRLANWAGRQFADCVAFAPDGRTLATGHADGTVLLWDLTPAWKGLAVPKGAVDGAACWADLADPDPGTAWAAAEKLVAAPAIAVQMIREKLRPETVDPRWLADRIADLASEDFKTRESATSELRRVAGPAEDDLRRAADAVASPESRRRLAEVLAAARPTVPPADVVRAVRAVGVLERIGSEEERAVLKALASGATGAELTREAGAAVGRLRSR